MRESLQSLGASSDTLSFVELAHRRGTANVYESKWKRWLAWTQGKRVDPLRPKVVQLANFLSELAASDHLSASSIKVFRSAIVSTLTQRGGRVRGSSERPRLVSDVVKGISASQSVLPRRTPAWDLFLVLEQLRQPPFEPLAQLDRFHLTWKTVFLVSLATGRRSSEVNHLSGLPADISSQPDGSFLLHFLPEFRAKNQRPEDSSPSVRIPPLSSILAPDDEDVTLCPVRALRRYLEMTRDRPSGCRKLFVSINPNYSKDVSSNTIARWVSSVVRLAYARAGASLPSSRAHEVRAWAASLAAHQNVPLRQVLDAAYWKSESTFLNFYLRDCSATRQDGTCGIASVVAAQRALTLH